MANPAGSEGGPVSPGAGIVRDEIYITDGPELRTIAVSQTLPPAMARSGAWRVEDFDLHKELYRGKTSLLYMATDRRSGIQVALKLYRKRKLSTLNRYQVEREIRIHIQLDHVNIIKLYSAFEDEKNVYMVQEFAGGGDLFEDLKRNGGQIKEKYVVRDIISPFLSALIYLHKMGIVHRDIKPENILLTTQKVIKIADFGLSININQERPVTRAGTLDYMAPEVLICPDKRRPEENKDKVLLAYTAQVDSWAVGILGFELLVGYPPFEQESRAATYELIMYKDPKFPGWMSEESKAFIGAALCKNATQRPTVSDLAKLPWILMYARPAEPAPVSTPPMNIERRSITGSSRFRPEMATEDPASAPAASALRPSGSLSLSGGGAAPGSPAQPSPRVAPSHAPAKAAEAYTGSISDPSYRTDSITSVGPSPLGKRELKVSTSGNSRNSTLGQAGAKLPPLLLDTDSSYSPEDFARATGGTDATMTGGPPGDTSAPPSPGYRPSSTRNSNPAAAAAAKHRLAIPSTGGSASSPSLVSLPGVKIPDSLMALRGSTHSNSGAAGAGGLSVERSSSSYYKPASGVLSDDASMPLVGRTGSISGKVSLSGLPIALAAAGGSSSGPMSPLGSDRMNKLERPSVGLTPLEEEHHPDGSTKGGSSKYAKLFAKMWGGGKSSGDADSLRVQASGSSSLGLSGSGGSMTGRLSYTAKGKGRNLQDELLGRLREDSMIVTGREGSVAGSPTMKFKQPTPQALQAMRAAQEAEAQAAPALGAGGKTMLLGKKGVLQDADAAGLQRVGSEASLMRPGFTNAMGRSFTSASSPSSKKLANGAVAQKVAEYVQSAHGGHGLIKAHYEER